MLKNGLNLLIQESSSLYEQLQNMKSCENRQRALYFQSCSQQRFCMQVLYRHYHWIVNPSVALKPVMATMP
uniref:Uncharacterized protein n=1 Tax=Kalanchoe fedtschenkoi TaxID=63787 RepID=A0A7N0T6P4_KALFE